MNENPLVKAVWPGHNYPRGATWDGQGVNFALFSQHATRVELCLFDEAGRHERQRIDMPERTDDVWHCYLPEARPGMTYGYRVHGPYKPEEGHRFNPHKLLIDPYAKELVGQTQWSDALYGYTVHSKRADLLRPGATVRASSRSRACSTPPSPGATIAAPMCPGRTW